MSYGITSVDIGKKRSRKFCYIKFGAYKWYTISTVSIGRYSGEIDGKYNKQTKNALWSFCVVENQKHRWTDESKIDPKLYEVLIKDSQKGI